MINSQKGQTVTSRHCAFNMPQGHDGVKIALLAMQIRMIDPGMVQQGFLSCK
jgi:hypothetical protein